MLPSLPQSVASTAFKNVSALDYHTAHMSSGLSPTGVSQVSCLVHKETLLLVFHLCPLSVCSVYPRVVRSGLVNKDCMRDLLLLMFLSPLSKLLVMP